MNDKNSSFVFYESFTDALDSIPDQTIKLEVYEAIAHYGTKGILPDNLSPYASAFFALVKPNIDSNIKKRAGGSKGGRPKTTNGSVDEKPMVTEEETYGYENEKPMVSDNENLRLENPKTNIYLDEDVDEDVDGDVDGDVDVNVDADEDGDVDVESPGGITDVIPNSRQANYDEIIGMYNTTCVSYPRIKVLSEKRKKAIKARLRTGYTMADFETVFRKAEASDFLKGKNDRNWSATFDWMIKDANMAKILDGNYDNKASPAKQDQGSGNYFLDILNEMEGGGAP